MAKNHANSSKSRAKAAPRETIADGAPAGAPSAAPTKPRKAPTANTSSAAVKAGAKLTKTSGKTSAKPIWLSALSTPTASARKTAARRPDPEALDDWVSAPAAKPASDESLTPPARSASQRPATKPVFAKTPKRASAGTSAAANAAPKRSVAAKPEGAPSAASAEPPGDRAAAPIQAEPALKPAETLKTVDAEAAPPAAAAEPPSAPSAEELKPAEPAPKPVESLKTADAEAAPPAAAAEPPSAPAISAAGAPPAAAPIPAPAPPAAGQGAVPGFGASYPMPNFEALARNVASATEQAGKAFTAYMRPRQSGEIKDTTLAEDLGEMVRSLGRLAEYYMSDPRRALEAQAALATHFIDLWASTLLRFQGGAAKPIAEHSLTDKRFSDAEWRDNPFFDFLKQAYVLTTQWAEDLVKHADDMEPHARHKAEFYLKQVSAALAPSNFIGTNPELLRATLAESGENLVRGLKMLAEDIEAGKGNIRMRQVDASAFQLGVNMANTPGKVIFRNDLIELIQYEPTTPEVYKRPLLIIPPWINKFYILDLNPEKSFIRWAVSQGLTVFVVSWVNPDGRHADKDFDAYMSEGILAAIDGVEQATGERKITAIGYCVGGTLLAGTLGYMAAVGDDRIDSVTFFTTQIDFTDAGDLKVFVDAEQLKQTEARMAEQGYLDGTAMAHAFNMLRPDDLIWSYYVNNYLKGKEPMSFDLLVWNSDATRMPAANHAFYLRHCYYDNDLSSGRMVLGGKTIDLKTVMIPAYELAAKEDHIAPARSAFTGAKSLGGPVRYVLAGSGHIAGVVNPPSKAKYQYWTGGPVEGAFEDWVKAARETPGSWWPDWIQWITAQSPEKVPARKPGEGKLKPLCDAPGEFVRMKS
jgi:polyhydroxyalkanoate synthase subunit PhaC